MEERSDGEDKDNLKGLISIARLPPRHDESRRRRGRAAEPEKIESMRRLQRLQAHEGKTFQPPPPIEFTWSSVSPPKSLKTLRSPNTTVRSSNVYEPPWQPGAGRLSLLLISRCEIHKTLGYSRD